MTHDRSSTRYANTNSIGHAPLTPSQIETLRQLDACRIANAIEEFDLRLRNEGFTAPGLRCFFPEIPTVLGYAVTSQIRCSNPPPKGHSYPDRTDWWEMMASVPGPRIAVIQDIDRTPGLGASVGEVHARVLQALGCVGVITNGSVRDLNSVRRLGFQMLACGVSPSHAYAHMIDFGKPVEICGLRINPGDLLCADRHGVVSIPHEIAAELPSAAARQAEKERQIIELCASDGFSVGRLRAEVELGDVH